MDKNNELANILRAELTLLTKDILQNIHQKDLKSLYKATRQLQEKMAAIMVLKDQLDTSELMEILKVRRAEEAEQPSTFVEKKTEETPVEIPEINDEIEEEQVKFEPEKVETKSEKPEVNPYKQAGKMRFVPKEQKSTSQHQETPKSPLPLKKMNVGLNDKISFIKHLFEGDHELYTNFIDKLNAFENYEDALRYINQEVKPQYEDWEGKDEYEFRLLQLLELKFA